MKNTRKTLLLTAYFVLAIASCVLAQDYQWSTTDGDILRDGKSCFLKGQSWAKKTAFTYLRGDAAEGDVKSVLTQLNQIGVNNIRIYGSPNDSDWDGSSNFHNLIKWIEEWNVDNPDGGDPNKAMYYMVQLSPADPQSTISSGLPENTEASIERTINDLTNPESVASLVKVVDDLTGGSKYLMGYLIYHELNVSSKYADWADAIGLQGINDIMDVVADSLHNRYAPGKLVTHTGDAKDDDDDIYQGIEELDAVEGNVFEKFDMLGFNLYISSDALITENKYYDRIVNRRALSVNNDRGWYIGETGPSFDKSANSSSVAAANYTNPEGGANLQIMYTKSRDLGNLIGFMLFTVQDNDLGTPVGDDIKQRGYYDVYGDTKFLYYVYPDVLDHVSSNYRQSLTDSYRMELEITDQTNQYQVSFQFENYSSTSAHTYRYTIYSDNGSGGSQRFGQKISDEYVTLAPCETMEISQLVDVPSSELVVVSASLIRELNPDNAYLWGREHVLEDAICTVAGLNQFLSNPQDPQGSPAQCQVMPADLGLNWESPSSEIFFGDTLNLELTVSNGGPSDASDVTIDFIIGDGFSLLETSFESGDLLSDNSTWTLDLLANNEDAKIEITVKVLESGIYSANATVRGKQEDTTTDNNESAIEIQPIQALSIDSPSPQPSVLKGKVYLDDNCYLNTPDGNWNLKVFDLSGMQIFERKIVGGQVLNLSDNMNTYDGIAIYFLESNTSVIRAK